jgi:hypothetical protein
MQSIPVGGPLGDPSTHENGFLGGRGTGAEGPEAAARSGASRAAAGGLGAAGPGLVSLETSVTRPSGDSGNPSQVPEVVEIDRHQARLKRMRRSVQAAAELLQAESQDSGRRWKSAMVTLTYRPDVQWEPGQATAFVRRVQSYLFRRGVPCCFVWVLELTQAGRPHYHVLFWLPRGLTLPKPDKQGWWLHGLTRIEWARSPVGYLVKYASKGIDGEELPKGARLSGCGGLSFAGRCVRSWRLCPAWVREIFTVEDRPVRAPGGGWLSRLTGAFEAARWRLEAHGPGWSWTRFVRIVPVGEVLPCPV